MKKLIIIMKKDIRLFIKEILYINKKYKNPKDIRKILKLSHPKDSVPTIKVN